MQYSIKPGDSVSAALGKLRPGDVLTLRGGDYLGLVQPSLHPGTEVAPITVRAYAGERPVIHGLVRLNNPSYWTIDGINCQWPTNLVDTHAHLFKVTGGVGWTLRNSEIWDAHSYAGLLVCGNANDWWVLRCNIHDTHPSNSTNQDHLIYVNTSPTAGCGQINHCLLRNAPNGEGVKIAGADKTGGSRDIVVTHNTILGCSQGVLVGWASNGCEVSRNLIGHMANGCVRAYELQTKDNDATENYGWAAKRMIDLYDGGVGFRSTSGNWFGTDPLLDSNYLPTLEAAKAYGRGAS